MISTGKPIVVELIDLVSCVIVFLSQPTSQRSLIFLLGSLIIPDKAKLFAEIFSENFNFDNSGTSISVFPCTTDLKLYNVPATPKMVKKFLTALDLSKASSPGWIPVVILKTSEPEFSYVLADLFIMCLKEFVFQIVGKSNQWFECSRILGRGLWLKTTALFVSYLF